MEAKRDPLSHRRRWLMNSGTRLGTSVEALAALTYASRQPLFFLVAISKQRILSSARYLEVDARSQRGALNESLGQGAVVHVPLEDA